MPNDGSTPNQANFKLLKPGTPVDWFLQKHVADRAGRHADARLGNPSTGLYSFALPRERFPDDPGQAVLAIEQPQHRYDYGTFSGTIEKGRGKGTVELKDTGSAVITSTEPDKIGFALLHTRNPKEYMLVRKQGKNWFLVNTTPTKARDALKYGKVRYKATDDPEPYYREGVTASPKIDGAAVLLRLMKDRAEVSSIRPSVTGAPINHTWRVGGLDRLHVPKQLQDSVFRAELYGKQGSKVIPAAELGGLLNTTTQKSIEAQRQRGIQLMLALYGIADLGTDVPKDRPGLRKLFKAVERTTGGKAHQLKEADTPEQARQLVSDITTGKHPLTNEGVVFTEPDQRTVKYVPRKEYDVYIKEVFPAATKDGSTRAGGFSYSLTPDGDVVGEVGSGFIRNDAEDMLNNPTEWVGRKARIRSRMQLPSGAYSSPVFIARHEG